MENNTSDTNVPLRGYPEDKQETIEVKRYLTSTDDTCICPREAQCWRQVAEEIFEELEEHRCLNKNGSSFLPFDTEGQWRELKAKWLKGE